MVQGRRKRGAGPAAAHPLPKVVKIGQKRVQTGLAVGTKDDPLELLTDVTTARGTAKRAHFAGPSSAHSLDSSRSAGVHVQPDDVHFGLQQHEADLDTYAAALAPKEVQPPETDANEDPVPNKVRVGTSATYDIQYRLGKGGFGQVFLGTKAVRSRAASKPAMVAVKFEKQTTNGQDQAAHEWQMYKEIGECYGLARFIAKGRVGEWSVMIMELLGRSLWDVHSSNPEFFHDRMLACCAMECITTLYHLHQRGYVHGDMKPENLVLGPQPDGQPPRLYLVDLGLTVRWQHGSLKRKSAYSSQPDQFRGTARYASLHAHLGRRAMPRDDLESLAYSLIYLADGSLPWQGFGGDEVSKRLSVAACKAATSARGLCERLPEPLLEFTEAVLSLGHDDQPDYAAYMKMFEPMGLYGPGPMPLTLAPVSLRPPRNVVPLPPPKKKLRQGLLGQQFCLVFNSGRTGKQRFVTGADTAMLSASVKEGWAEDLHITCATAGRDHEWCIVLSSTTYTQQAYNIYHGLVDTEWVSEHWESGFYITSIAGFRNREHTLTVMSAGTSYTQQTYKVFDDFPYDWIKTKWDEGFFVTAASTVRQRWVIVMSKGESYVRQAIELDYAYPSDAIHQRWSAGYRITACASTSVQTAVFMSLPKRGLRDSGQETLRNDAWPTDCVKQKWEAGMYIAAASYGRTLH